MIVIDGGSIFKSNIYRLESIICRTNTNSEYLELWSDYDIELIDEDEDVLLGTVHIQKCEIWNLKHNYVV